MSTNYPHDIEKMAGNVTISGDYIFAHYILTGYNVTSASPESLERAQDAHDSLLKVLAGFALPFSIFGFKARTDPDELIARMSIPGLTNDNLPNYRRSAGAFASKLNNGDIKEFQRIYWLQVQLPRDVSTMNKLLDTVLEDEDFDDYDKMSDVEEDIFKHLPSSFKPMRAHTDHLRWVFDRARYRGIKVPFAPTRNPEPQERFSLGSFPTVYYEWNADGEALASNFARTFAEGNNRKEAKKSFFTNFRTTQYANAMSISNPAERRPEFPNGPMSYQSYVNVISAPKYAQYPYSTITNLVDTIVSVDADFVQHCTFDYSMMSKSNFRKLRSRITTENESLSKDDLDTEEYQENATEIEKWRQKLFVEGGSIPMLVSTTFCFAHQNLDYLNEEVTSIIDQADRNNFKLQRIVGGQRDGFHQMIPGATHSQLVEETKLPITARDYASSVPMRTSVVGDHKGFPVAVNRSNSLGQIIYFDLLNSTNQGSGSIATVGAQGSGKSHFIKYLLGILFDMEKTIHVIDPSTHGEYEVFARSLSNVTVVNVTRGNVSMDPLKLYPPEKAKKEFLDIMVPLLNIDMTSNGAAILSRMLEPQFRAARGIESTRDLITIMEKVAKENKDLERIYNALNFFASQSYTAVLIDPIDPSGRVIDIPALDPQTDTVVYRTSGLDTSDSEDKTTASALFSQAILTSIAVFAQYRFSQIDDVCAFVADEIGRFKNNKIISEKVIENIDTMGRKEKNIVIAGSQLAKHMNNGFDLVRKRLILRQEKNANAVNAFEWADIEPNDFLVERMTRDTSPMDPNTSKTVRGREGEGWYNDGQGNISRIKIMNHLLPSRITTSDTTSSNMIRAN